MFLLLKYPCWMIQWTFFIRKYHVNMHKTQKHFGKFHFIENDYKLRTLRCFLSKLSWCLISICGKKCVNHRQRSRFEWARMILVNRISTLVVWLFSYIIFIMFCLTHAKDIYIHSEYIRMLSSSHAFISFVVSFCIVLCAPLAHTEKGPTELLNV